MARPSPESRFDAEFEVSQTAFYDSSAVPQVETAVCIVLAKFAERPFSLVRERVGNLRS